VLRRRYEKAASVQVYLYSSILLKKQLIKSIFF